MARFFDYVILRVSPDPRRGERVNIGLAVISAKGIDVRIIPSPRKVQALAGDFEISALFSLEKSIPQCLPEDATIDDLRMFIKGLGVISTSEPGYFSADTDQNYEKSVSSLMRKLVYPRPKKRLPMRATRLQTEIKNIFIKYEIFSSQTNDVDKHRVVQNYPVLEEDNLFVDFATKNGTYHFTETLDLRVASTSRSGKFKEAGLAAVTLDQAAKVFGNESKRFFVYAASPSDERQADAHIRLASEYSDYTLNFCSAVDRALYVDRILKAVGHSY